MKRLLRTVALTLLLASITRMGISSSPAAEDAVTVTPAHLANGSPCLFTAVFDTEAVTVTGRWQGRTIPFFPSPDRKTWYALAGLDVEVKPGVYPLTVEAELRNAHHQTLHHEISVDEAPYAEVTLHVPDKFVEPTPRDLKIIAADKRIKDKVFASSAPAPQWSTAFSPPLKSGVQSDSFGTRRVFNGTLASVHRGLDFHAKTGTPVAAINSGRVVLATPLYYEGGCIIIDHGMGLMSIYMHLSKFEVKPGARVRRGQIIALSGASGRATGPHLHLGVRWEGSYLDPAKLFTLELPTPSNARPSQPTRTQTGIHVTK